jgi:hypothetical protein
MDAVFSLPYLFMGMFDFVVARVLSPGCRQRGGTIYSRYNDYSRPYSISVHFLCT